jgi:hypothetical protein
MNQSLRITDCVVFGHGMTADILVQYIGKSIAWYIFVIMAFTPIRGFSFSQAQLDMCKEAQRYNVCQSNHAKSKTKAKRICTFPHSIETLVEEFQSFPRIFNDTTA